MLFIGHLLSGRPASDEGVAVTTVDFVPCVRFGGEGFGEFHACREVRGGGSCAGGESDNEIACGGDSRDGQSGQLSVLIDGVVGCRGEGNAGRGKVSDSCGIFGVNSHIKRTSIIVEDFDTFNGQLSC